MIDDFIKEFTNEKLVKKYLYKYTWLSGSSTTVFPITIGLNDITIQWKSNKNIFNKFIKGIIEKYNTLFESGYFVKSDGSCPSCIVFKLRKDDNI